MKKYAVGLEYCGAAYCGWQRQSHCDSIQQHVEAALGFVANHPIELVCAGRTDAGVHAMEQVVHFESPEQRSESAWVRGSNCRLPPDIRLKWAVPVADDFHARYSARSRAYRYVVFNAEVPSALFHNRCGWEFQSLDHVVMHECAQVLLGEHDFSSFRASGCQSRSPNRNVHEVSVSRRGDLVYVDIRANAFLYHMVRNITGSLLTVGRGEQDATWFSEVFQAGDRRLAGKTAAACGLYFLQASYDEQFNLPTRLQNPVLF